MFIMSTKIMRSTTHNYYSRSITHNYIPHIYCDNNSKSIYIYMYIYIYIQIHNYNEVYSRDGAMLQRNITVVASAKRCYCYYYWCCYYHYYC